MQLQSQTSISVRKFEEFGFQPSFIIQRETQDLSRPYTLKKIDFSDINYILGSVQSDEDITIPAGKDRILIPIRFRVWKDNLREDLKLPIALTVLEANPKSVTATITIHHQKTPVASESSKVAKILEILAEEVETKVQLLSPQLFEEVDFNLFRRTDPAYTFALLYPEAHITSIQNCLTTFPEIQQSTVEAIYTEQKLILQVWKLLKSDRHPYAKGDRIYYQNFLQRFWSRKLPELPLEAKRILRCTEHSPCTAERISVKVCRSVEVVEETLKELEAENLVQRVRNSDFFEIANRGRKKLNQYRTLTI